MGLLFEPRYERPRPWQGHVEIIDTKEQEEAVARLGVIGARQGGMLVGTPLVEAEQDRSIRVEDFPEVVMGGTVSGRPSSDWYHLKLPGTSRTPIIVHVRFMGSLLRPSHKWAA